MDSDKIKMIHALARQKGLIHSGAFGVDDELYRLRLRAHGVESCKELKRNTFNAFVKELKALPDAITRRAA